MPEWFARRDALMQSEHFRHGQESVLKHLPRRYFGAEQRKNIASCPVQVGCHISLQYQLHRRDDSACHLESHTRAFTSERGLHKSKQLEDKETLLDAAHPFFAREQVSGVLQSCAQLLRRMVYRYFGNVVNV